jgi:threonylcarbamoyladenosine tRNA methylthiotransferase MtaB
VMVGFPGENDRHFANTVKLIADLPVAYLHVFPYSRRPGTPAADFPDHVTETVKKDRAATLRALGKEKRQAFAKRFLGCRLSVLVESKTDRAKGFLKGFSDRYIPVLIRNGRPSLLNRLVDVFSEEVCDGQIIGRVADHE